MNLQKFKKSELIDFINALGFDSKFGMYQRDFAIRLINGASGYILFLDLDDFKKLNSKFGYVKTDKIVNDAFLTFTQNKKYVVFRWFSGDEIVIFSKSKISKTNLYTVQNKIKFTAAVKKFQNGELTDTINMLSEKVMRLKNTFQKGTILYL